LGGDEKVVEIDESKFGKRKYHRGHRVEGQWVVGGFERGSGRVFMVPVESRDEATLIDVIRKWVLPGSLIITDCWKGYINLESEGFQHLTVNHRVGFVDKETGAHTNGIEGSWRRAEVFLPQYHRKKQLYASYLAHYMFLRYCKAANACPFFEFFKCISQVVYVNENFSNNGSDSEFEDDVL
jgi:transposase-like protein